MPNTAADVQAGAPNVQHYDGLGDGTVLDDVTQLRWQASVAPNDKYSLAAANAYCAELELGELTGWRVPTFIELLSIVDFSKQVPAIDPEAFPNTPRNGSFWTTSFIATSRVSRTIDFLDGLETSSSGPNDSLRVRCVWKKPAEHPREHYQSTADTVYDTGTQLTWQRAAPSGFQDQEQVSDYCANLPHDGVPWRLPTLKELFTLVDMRTKPSIDLEAFPDTPVTDDDVFWSATHAVGGQPMFLWIMRFNSGFPAINNIGKPGRVRCVR